MTHDVVWRVRSKVDENLSRITLLAIAIPRLRRNQSPSIGEKARVSFVTGAPSPELRRPGCFACINKPNSQCLHERSALHDAAGGF